MLCLRPCACQRFVKIACIIFSACCSLALNTFYHRKTTFVQATPVLCEYQYLINMSNSLCSISCTCKKLEIHCKSSHTAKTDNSDAKLSCFAIFSADGLATWGFFATSLGSSVVSITCSPSASLVSFLIGVSLTSASVVVVLVDCFGCIAGGTGMVAVMGSSLVLGSRSSFSPQHDGPSLASFMTCNSLSISKKMSFFPFGQASVKTWRLLLIPYPEYKSIDSGTSQVSLPSLYNLWICHFTYIHHLMNLGMLWWCHLLHQGFKIFGNGLLSHLVCCFLTKLFAVNE